MRWGDRMWDHVQSKGVCYPEFLLRAPITTFSWSLNPGIACMPWAPAQLAHCCSPLSGTQQRPSPLRSELALAPPSPSAPHSSPAQGLLQARRSRQREDAHTCRTLSSEGYTRPQEWGKPCHWTVAAGGPGDLTQTSQLHGFNLFNQFRPPG